MQQPFDPNQYQVPQQQPYVQQPYVQQPPVQQPPVQAQVQQPYQPQPVQTVVQPSINTSRMGEFPVSIACPHCKAQVTTRTTKKMGALPWIACLALCFFGFDCGCCLIPFCITSLYDTYHHCPQCNNLIGKHSAI